MVTYKVTLVSEEHDINSTIDCNDDVFVLAVGSNTNVGGVVPDQVVSGCGAFNTNDNVRLTTSTGTLIDLWGRTDGVDFTPNNANLSQWFI